MQTLIRTTGLAAVTMVVGSCASTPPQPNPKDMTFFVTSAGPGKGADLGGLEGATCIAPKLARAAGAPDRTWRAYLSTQAPGLRDTNFVNARDRIGTAPWLERHGRDGREECRRPAFASSNLTKQTALTERGQVVNGTSGQAQPA